MSSFMVRHQPENASTSPLKVARYVLFGRWVMRISWRNLVGFWTCSWHITCLPSARVKNLSFTGSTDGCGGELTGMGNGKNSGWSTLTGGVDSWGDHSLPSQYGLSASWCAGPPNNAPFPLNMLYGFESGAVTGAYGLRAVPSGKKDPTLKNRTLNNK